MNKELLVEKAKEMLAFSYTPYSNFKVGAALLCRDGSVYTGCNIENASFGPSMCAERTAFFKAVSEGKKESQILEAEADKQAAILHAEAVKESKIREAEGEAEAIRTVKKAFAEGIKYINEANPSESYIKIKSLEAFEKAADGQATKIIMPSEIQRLAGLADGIAETIKK